MNDPAFPLAATENDSSTSERRGGATYFSKGVVFCGSAVAFYYIIIPVFKILLFGLYSINHNFHEVVPGQLYRSSSMMAQDLVDTIERYKIRTVFDLRTHESTKDKKGKLESITVSTSGAQYVHFRMETLKKLSAEQVHTLIELFNTVERPVLIHCSSGSERTSVAVAIWLLSQTTADVSTAQSQLALSYGYLEPWLMFKQWRHNAPTINRTVEEYFESSERHHLSFKEWVQVRLKADGMFADTQTPNEDNIH